MIRKIRVFGSEPYLPTKTSKELNDSFKPSVFVGKKGSLLVPDARSLRANSQQCSLWPRQFARRRKLADLRAGRRLVLSFFALTGLAARYASVEKELTLYE
jgi:hypothetical protein